jgi:hypothetical protein
MDLIVAPLRTHDMPLAVQLHVGAALVSYWPLGSQSHLAKRLKEGVFCVFRVRQRFMDSFRKGRPCVNNNSAQATRKPSRNKGRVRDRPSHSRWIKRLGKLDHLLEYNKPQSRPSRMSA